MHLAYILFPPGFWLRCQNPRRHPWSPHVNKYAFCFCLFVLFVWYTYGSIEVWILDRLEHSEEHKWYQMVFSMVISIWYWSLLSKPFLGSDSRTIPTEVSIWWPKPRIEMPVWNLVLRFCFRNFAVAMVLMQSLRRNTPRSPCFQWWQNSPWAKTPKFRISYHSGGQRLPYIFRNLSSSTLFLSMIAVSTEQLSCLNHVIKWRHQYQVMLLFITDYCKIPSSNLHFMINDGLK